MAKTRDKGGKHREILIGSSGFIPHIPPEKLQAIEAEWLGTGANRTLVVHDLPIEWCSSFAITAALYDKAERVADGKLDN